MTKTRLGSQAASRGIISILRRYRGMAARSRTISEKAKAQGARRNRSRTARRENRAEIRPSTA